MEREVLVQLAGSGSVADHHKPAPAGDDLVIGLTGESLARFLATQVLVAVLVSGVLGPVLTSHWVWVHGGLDEDGDHVLPVNDIEGHDHLLPRSEVTTSRSMTMRMDAYLSLSLPPQCCSGCFDEGDGDNGLPVGGSELSLYTAICVRAYYTKVNTPLKGSPVAVHVCSAFYCVAVILVLAKCIRPEEQLR